MPRPVELILGPARSGKAKRVREAYLEALAGPEPGKALMLVPTALRCRATESRLLAAQKAGVLLRPRVLTFHDLAERLLAAAGRPVRRITGLARRHLIRECLAALDKKRAAVLGPARRMPGLVEALDALFRELKDARVEPDALGRALVGRLRSQRNRVLAHLYAAYQRTLQQRDLYDDAGRFWHAAALVAEGEFGPFSDLAILVVDGFQDFVPAQLDMLQNLSRRAARTLITLAYEPDRPTLFGVTGRTRRRLIERFGKRLTEVPADEPGRLPASLDRVRRHLFRMPDGSALPAADESLSVIRAAGHTRQVEEVGRQISDLVRGGANRPGGIAVLARSLATYAPLVREIFPRYGLRFRVDARRPLGDCPVIRAAATLVRLQAEGYAYRALGRLLRSTYFSAEAFGSDAETARAAVRLARQANVWEGRESYFKGFDYLRSRIRRSADALDDAGEAALAPHDAKARLDEIERAEAFLKRLFDGIGLSGTATRRAFAERLRAIIRTAGLWSAAGADPDPMRRARDLKALAAFEGVLAEVAAIGEDNSAEVPRETFLAEVMEGVGLADVPAEEPADAPVVVMDVLQCRAMTFGDVFVLGVSEKEFPRRGRRHPFFDDNERHSLRRRGVDLSDTGHDAEREMLLFYMAVTRAERGLTLAYSSLDAHGRPALQSHYLDELAGLFAAGPTGERLRASAVGTRDLDLPAEAARSQRELLAATMFGLWGPGQTRRMKERLALLDALLARGEAAETALTGLALELERERGERFGPFDGILAARDILEDLCRQFPGETVMSARRLETFGGCPFAFLATTILGLEPIEEPSADLGPLDVGLIYHGLLERFFSALVESETLDARLTDQNCDAALALLEEAGRKYFKHLEDYGRTGSHALWKVQKQNILRDVRRLVRWHIEAKGQADWRPAYVEVGFGAAGPGRAKPPGRKEPLVLPTPHGRLRVRGRIDRIDLAAEGAGFQVIDYKSGSRAPSHSQMKRGTSFQLPIYLWAAAELLGNPLESTAARAFFLTVRSLKQSGLLANTSDKAAAQCRATLQRAEAYVHSFIDAMRLGKFAVWPEGDACGHCDVAGVCRYAEWRLRPKWERNPIPELERFGNHAEENREEDT